MKPKLIPESAFKMRRWRLVRESEEIETQILRSQLQNAETTDDAKLAMQTVTAQDHARASLAHLLNIMLADETIEDSWPEIRSLIRSEDTKTENLDALCRRGFGVAKKIGIEPALLSLCVILWRRGADQEPIWISGLDDWYGLPSKFLTTKTHLTEDIKFLSQDLEHIFISLNAEPEVAMTLALKKSQALSHQIATLLKQIKGAKDRRHRLFNELTKLHVEVYYWKKIRRTEPDSHMARAFQTEGEIFDLAVEDDRKRMNRKADDATRSVQRLIDSVMADYGIVRVKRKYIPFDDRKTALGKEVDCLNCCPTRY